MEDIRINNAVKSMRWVWQVLTLLSAVAGLLEPFVAACNTISAALEHQHQKQQQQHVATEQQQQQEKQQQQQQQQQSPDTLIRIGVRMLVLWFREATARNAAQEKAAAAAAAAAAACTRKDAASVADATAATAVYGWLFTDAAVHSSGVVPTVARLAMALACTTYSSSSNGSSSSSVVDIKVDRFVGSSSSSSLASRSMSAIIRSPSELLPMPVPHAQKVSVVGGVATLFAKLLSQCYYIDQLEGLQKQVLLLMHDPHVQQLLLLDMGLSVQALHQQRKGIAALPEVAAAVAAALQPSACEQQQQRLGRGNVAAWHEQLLLCLRVPAAEITAAAAAAAVAGRDAAVFCCGRAAEVLRLALKVLPLQGDASQDKTAAQTEQQQQQREELQASSCVRSTGAVHNSSSHSSGCGSEDVEHDACENTYGDVPNMLPDKLQLPLLWTMLELLLLLDCSREDAAHLPLTVVEDMVQIARDVNVAAATAAHAELLCNEAGAPGRSALVPEVCSLLSAVLQLPPVLFAAAAAAAGILDTAVLATFVEFVCKLAGFPGLTEGKNCYFCCSACMPVALLRYTAARCLAMLLCV
jgi:hypothetical protein